MAELLSTNNVTIFGCVAVNSPSNVLSHNACLAASVAAMNSASQDDNATFFSL
jgi:hypothetical protein